ncbi:serine protease [Colwellia sp. Arc7-635]|uniref:S1 family peptidase n=1 Tax=Colwellia sp. Arc7-635 TaxID=2497879 RepID=UPI000F857005|nr:serine protease [Colwellia sp. Arc7-635]AZQ84904.1 serine protease [Colwellia sp. Arc7-635]
MSLEEISHKFQINSTFIIESLDESGENIARGTCFAITPFLVLTAKHVITHRNKFRCYLKSDDFKNNIFYTLEVIEHDSDWDFAILRLASDSFSKFIPLGDVEIPLSTKVQICGYPIEAVYINSLVDVSVTNIYSDILTHDYSFEVSQSSTVKDYQGMSGSPVLYKGYAIGVLVVQRASTILKVLSISDIISRIPDLSEELRFETILQDEIDYSPPLLPLLHFR